MSLNGEKMLDIMSDVDSALIISAESARKSKKLFIKIAAAAASVTVAAAVGLSLIPKNGSWTPLSSEELPELPMLTIENLMQDGMGFEGYDAVEFEEIKNTMDEVNVNFNIREMPVYTTESANPDVDVMRARLRETAEYFGLDYDSLDISETVANEQQLRETFEPLGAPEEEIQRMLKQSRMMTYMSAHKRDENGMSIMSISIDASLTVSVSLTHPETDEAGNYKEAGGIEIPEEYDFIPGASRKEQEKAGRYLIEKYNEFIDMKNPVFVLKPTYDADTFAYVEFYEKGESDGESIANQEIKHVAFSSTADGKLGRIRIWEEYKHCEKIADYPISNLEQAMEMLKNGEYLTSVPYDLTGEEEISFVNLTYWSGYGQSLVMPYYRFLVKVPEEEVHSADSERETYGAYYVPAVRIEYIENPEDLAISFNGVMITK